MIEIFSNPQVLAVVSFAFASFLIELTPGPNMTWLAILSLSEGRRAGFAAVAGVALGLAIVGVAAALGLTAIIREEPALYEGLRWAGVVFLLYLAWDGWQSSAVDAPGGSANDGKHFARGLLTNLLNPKAAAFYVTVLPAFTVPGEDFARQTWLLTAVYVAVATAIHAGIVLLAGAAKPLLTDPARERLVRRTLSLLLAAVAVWFAFKTAR